jgi:hydrogenase maturation protease
MNLRGRVVVIGIGNTVRSDDGLGIRALQRLGERYQHGSCVELVEGGTAGLMLLPYIAAADRAIIIDAINVGAPAGTLIRLDQAQGVFASGLTPHDVGLSDLLDAARLTDAWPDSLVLHGIQPASTAFGTELTSAVTEALEPLVDAVEAELSLWGYAPARRRLQEPLPTGPARPGRAVP